MSQALTTSNQTRDALEQRARRPVWAPAADVYENGDEYLIYTDLPGIPADSLDIKLDADTLTIFARAPEPTERSVSLSADYQRRFTLPAEIDRDKVKAEMHAGVLMLHLPKSEAVKPRRIQVRSS